MTAYYVQPSEESTDCRHPLERDWGRKQHHPIGSVICLLLGIPQMLIVSLIHPITFLAHLSWKPAPELDGFAVAPSL